MRQLKLQIRPTGGPLGIRRQSGLSVIEVMVALAASLVVVGAVLAFTVATVRANAETISATRLTQELRVVQNLVIREIRRAGYDRNAERQIASGLPGIRYTAVTLDGDCLIIAYNRGNNPGVNPQAGEWKGFRRAVVGGLGVVQFNMVSTPPDCDSNTGWENLTNPQQVDISLFDLDLTEADIASLPGGIEVTVRDVSMRIQGSLVTDPQVVRELRERVRIRTDDVVFPP